MRRLLRVVRPGVLGIAAVAAISIVGTAVANRAIRDNTVNTRDIKDNQVNTRDLRNNSITTRDIRDNQVNTRDLRDNAIRSMDVHDGSLDASDLNASTAALLGKATLFDPRAHDQDNDGDGKVDNSAGSVAGHACCLSWSQGPTELSEVAGSASDPLQTATAGRGWREVVLDPGVYLIQTTASAETVGSGAQAAATRLFLGGKPVGDQSGYHFIPVSPGPFPVSHTYVTAIEVPQGKIDERRLLERAIAVGGAVKLSDDFLILEVARG